MLCLHLKYFHLRSFSKRERAINLLKKKRKENYRSFHEIVPISGIHTQKLSKKLRKHRRTRRVRSKVRRVERGWYWLLLLLLLLQHCRPFVSRCYRTRISRNNARASSNTKERIALSEKKKHTGYRVNERMRNKYKNR